MNFQLTKEQDFVRKTVREFAEKEIAPIAAEIDVTECFPMENVRKMGELGILGIPFPTEYGGADGDYLSYAIAVEEVARCCGATAASFSVHTSTCVWPMYHFGTEEQKAKYLKDLVTGQKIGGFALTEPGAGSDAGGLRTHAELVDGKWVINGSKCFISNAGVGSTFIVMALTDRKKGTHGGITAFIIEKGDPGFSIGKIEDKLGIRASSTGELIFENCVIPEDRVIGQVGQGFQLAMQVLDGGRITMAAQALGIAQGAFDATVEYMQSRKQFGKKLSQFQALQFKMADIKTNIEAARLLVYRAANMKDQGLQYGEAAAMAKLFASKVAMDTTIKCVQYHGGYGYTKDYPVERMMRDAKITEIYEGTSEIQKLVIAGKIFKK